MNTQPKDSPTHRLHILQVSLNEFKDWTTQLQARRAAIVEKLARAKASTALTREAAVNKQLKRILDKLERDLSTLETDTADVEDNMNKARALFWELSGGEVLIEHTEAKNGVTTESP